MRGVDELFTDLPAVGTGWPVRADLVLLLVLLGQQPLAVAAHDAGQQAAAGRHVDHRPVGDARDHPGVAPADPERVDVEALEPHLHVPVLDRGEHLLGHRHVLLDHEVALLHVLLDQPVPVACSVSIPSATPCPP